MRTMFLTLAAWVGMTAAAVAQPPDHPVLVIQCKLTEVTADGERRVLSEPKLYTLPNRPATFRTGCFKPVANPRGAVLLVGTGFTATITPSALRDCKFRLN